MLESHPKDGRTALLGALGATSPLMWSGLGAKRLKESGETVVVWKRHDCFVRKGLKSAFPNVEKLEDAEYSEEEN